MLLENARFPKIEKKSGFMNVISAQLENFFFSLKKMQPLGGRVSRKEGGAKTELKRPCGKVESPGNLTVLKGNSWFYKRQLND